MKITIEDLKNTLQTRTSGVLSHGGHAEPPSGRVCYVCAEELVALTRKLEWTDCVPGRYVLGNICRNLNDLPVWESDASRTETLLPLLPYLDEDGEADWLKNFAMRIAREIIPTFLGPFLLPHEVEEWKNLTSPKQALPIIAATLARFALPRHDYLYAIFFRVKQVMEDLSQASDTSQPLDNTRKMIISLVTWLHNEKVVKEICKILLDFFAHKI